MAALSFLSIRECTFDIISNEVQFDTSSAAYLCWVYWRTYSTGIQAVRIHNGNSTTTGIYRTSEFARKWALETAEFSPELDKSDDS